MSFSLNPTYDLAGVNFLKSPCEYGSFYEDNIKKDLNHIEPSVSGQLTPRANEVSEGVNWT